LGVTSATGSDPDFIVSELEAAIQRVDQVGAVARSSHEDQECDSRNSPVNRAEAGIRARGRHRRRAIAGFPPRGNDDPV